MARREAAFAQNAAKQCPIRQAFPALPKNAQNAVRRWFGMFHDPGKRYISQSITPVKENYLKVLLELSKGEAVRSSDVAASLDVTKASVSAMMKRFSEDGYITMEKYGAITLTKKGRVHAAAVKKRYNLLIAFFVSVLGVDPETAAADACQIEHCISAESLCKMEERLKCVSS